MLIERPANLVGLGGAVYRRNILDVGPQINDILITESRVEGERECWIVMTSIRGNAIYEGIGKLAQIPGSNAVIRVRGNIRW